MDFQENPSGQSRSILIVIIIVMVGVLGAGIGGFFAWKNSQGVKVDVSSELTDWCQLRSDWAAKADPIAADIMVKSVRPEDKAEHDKLLQQRQDVANEFGAKLREMKYTEPGIQAVEMALIKEGKVRANIAVEVQNILNQVEVEDIVTLNKHRDTLRKKIVERIKEGRNIADDEIKQAMTQLKGFDCSKLYRGPLTDENTADSPYISWDELEFRRTRAIAAFDEAIKKEEPKQEYINRVYHEIIRQYRPLLSGCFQKAKKRNPSVSDQMGMRIRLKPNGEVKTLAIEWMENQDDKLLDCLLEKAAKWRLPRPESKTEVIVVPVDFSKI